jgi:hypothetical protein
VQGPGRSGRGLVPPRSIAEWWKRLVVEMAAGRGIVESEGFAVSRPFERRLT